MKVTVLGKEQNTKVIQKDMFGLFFEDINYGLDGGLYAEMLENRHFEFLEGRGRKGNYYQNPAYQYGWSCYPAEGSVQLTIEEEMPLNTVNPHYLKVVAEKTGEGFANKAYDGIFMKPEVGCKVSFYARKESQTDEDMIVEIQIRDKAGNPVCVSGQMIISSEDWQKYETRVSSSQDIEGGTFAVILHKAGVVYFDQFSMMPEDAVCGLFRKDLAEILKEMKPGFLRFPGGCVVEGNELTNRYQWKLTLGPVEQRKSNWNRWAVHGNDEKQDDLSVFAHYNQTLGIGYYEYFLLCEYLECEPLPIMNVGLACQYQSYEFVPSDAPEFQEYVQDALDLIEFANGPADSKWGKIRAEMGHPESFGLTMLGIGNEQWETEKIDFFHRYEVFEKAIHDRYPEIRCIGSAGPDVTTERYTKAWEHYTPVLKERPEYAYAVDEHYYVPDTWLYENVHFYDNYPRSNKVFAGEYACHIHPEEVPERRNSFESALAEAAFMTGLEKNCDVVLLASYAPLFARLGYAQWQPDLIWFDAKKAYKTPNYYVQQMYSCYTGDTLLQTESGDLEERKVYVTASLDTTTDKIFVKLINAGEMEQTIQIELPKENINKVEVLSLQGELTDCNSIAEPEKVAPKKEVKEFDGTVVVPAHSIQVLTF